jgi:hypothetical protein
MSSRDARRLHSRYLIEVDEAFYEYESSRPWPQCSNAAAAEALLGRPTEPGRWYDLGDRAKPKGCHNARSPADSLGEQRPVRFAGPGTIGLCAATSATPELPRA